MEELKKWLEEQFTNLSNEETEVAIAQYKREGMLIATQTIMSKIEELDDENNILDRTQEEVNEAEGPKD